MSTLFLAVAHADEQTEHRAVQALEAAGIAVYRSWLDPRAHDRIEELPPPAPARPRGPFAVLAAVAVASVLGMLVAAIWLVDWRWAATAVVAFVAAFLALGLSMSRK